MTTSTLVSQRILPPDEPPTLSELFHENSKQKRYDHAFFRRIASVNASPALHSLLANVYKRYPGAALMPLPAAANRLAGGFEQLAAARRSVRRFTGAQIDQSELARLLFCGSGITGELTFPGEGTGQPVRAAPSGGALYPIEVYPIVRSVADLEPGVYHYHSRLHALEQVSPGESSILLGEAANDPMLFANASVTIALTAMFTKTKFKYGERGYRFALLEAGHIAQNLLLAATSAGLGATAIGGFIDDEVNALIGIDGVEEAALYLIPIGHPVEPAASS